MNLVNKVYIPCSSEESQQVKLSHNAIRHQRIALVHEVVVDSLKSNRIDFSTADGKRNNRLAVAGLKK